MSQPAAHMPPAGGHETRDVRISSIVRAGIAIVGLTVFTMATMLPLLGFYRERETAEGPKASPLAKTYGLTQPPEPRLQIDPAADIAALRAQEQSMLDSYAVLDKAAGRVRIPIAEAMKLVAQRRGGAAPR